MTKGKSVGEKIKENPWVLSTLILGVVAVVLIFSSFLTVGISPEKVGKNFVNFINAQGETQIEYVSAEAFGNDLYQVIVLADGKEVPVHVTQDGKYFVQIISPLEPEEPEEPEETEPTELNIPKSDKPVVELFVMSHCPYGTMAEKGILPALEVLGDTIDFELRFAYYAMHPTQGEVQEQLNEYCIQKNEEEKLFEYLTCFLGKTGTPEDGQACLAEVGIDQAQLVGCVYDANGEFSIIANLEDTASWLSGKFPLFNIDKELNEEYGVRGSPTLVINGVRIDGDPDSCTPAKQESGECALFSLARDPASYLNAICAGFNDLPEVCGTALTTTAYGPGFGYDTTSAGSSASCG